MHAIHSFIHGELGRLSLRRRGAGVRLVSSRRPDGPAMASKAQASQIRHAPLEINERTDVPFFFDHLTVVCCPHGVRLSAHSFIFRLVYQLRATCFACN